MSRLNPPEDCIKTETVLYVQWTNCPTEVREEVKRLWVHMEYGNDDYYYSWVSKEDGKRYPIIDAYLKSRDVTECLINWWW